MRFGIVVFPGSNCDHDCYYVLKHVFGVRTHYIWHEEVRLEGYDCIVIPGGFSYGDYLRPGAIASFSPVVKAIMSFVKRGGKVLGICNGFQILTEIGLLPGALMTNRSLSFVCDNVFLKVENNSSSFTSEYEYGEVIRMPVAHADGSFFAEDEVLRRLENNGQIVFRYCSSDGVFSDEANPNGSVANIAAVINESGSVLGTMPHPERACESVIGGVHGKKIFESLMTELM